MRHLAVCLGADFRMPVGTVTIGPVDNIVLTGPTLRRERCAVGLSRSAVARAYGASVPRIAQLEQQSHVQRQTAERYLTALDAAQRERAQRATEDARALAREISEGIA